MDACGQAILCGQPFQRSSQDGFGAPEYLLGSHRNERGTRGMRPPAFWYLVRYCIDSAAYNYILPVAGIGWAPST